MSDVISNSEATKADIKLQCKEFGRREGMGNMARLDFLDWITARARDGEAVVEDAAEYWGDYQGGANERAYETGEKIKDDSKQRSGEVKHFILLGSNTLLEDPCEQLATARRVLANMREAGTATGLKTWQVMVDFAKLQNEGKNKERALTEQELEGIFRAKAKRATDELDRLTATLGTLKKVESEHERLNIDKMEERERYEANGVDHDDPRAHDVEDEDEDGTCAGISRAIELIEARIAVLGGTRKDQRKAERARVRQAKAEAKARAKEARAAA